MTEKEKHQVQSPDESTLSSREVQSRSLINKYMLGAMAAGVIPAPAFDVAAIAGIQLKMLHSLSKLYDIPFSENSGKSIIASLVGGLGATSLATGTFGTLIKMIPVVGPLAGAVTMPVLAGAATYAVGMVFIQHFEAGGTLLDFDPAKVKKHFQSLYREGQQVASKAKKQEEETSE